LDAPFVLRRDIALRRLLAPCHFLVDAEQALAVAQSRGRRPELKVRAVRRRRVHAVAAALVQRPEVDRENDGRPIVVAGPVDEEELRKAGRVGRDVLDGDRLV
jgi:hypothetical protein